MMNDDDRLALKVQLPSSTCTFLHHDLSNVKSCGERLIARLFQQGCGDGQTKLREWRDRRSLILCSAASMSMCSGFVLDIRVVSLTPFPTLYPMGSFSGVVGSLL